MRPDEPMDVLIFALVIMVVIATAMLHANTLQRDVAAETAHQCVEAP